MPELFKGSGSKVQQAESNQVHKIVCLIEFAPALALGTGGLENQRFKKKQAKKLSRPEMKLSAHLEEIYLGR